MAIKYKITVLRIDTDVPFKAKDYEQTSIDEDGKPVYGYVYSDDTHNISTQILEQTVEELDIKALVSVVNSLGDTD